ncbi:MAG TPA: hypothetical protein VFM94_09885 [Solirubrobacterales bacterium]|nr:hypothetical protein [Solirubrobacterales bacterium]
MREALNSNPLAQAAVIGVLLVCVAIFVVSSGGGGEEEGGEPAATSSSVSTTGTALTESTPPAGAEGGLEAVGQSAAAAAPPLPRPLMRAWKANQTPVLLFVRDGGIDDRLVKTATAGLAGFRGTAVFIVPAHQISRYAAITEGVGVDRVPALVVVTPRRLDQSVPTASVSYGFQSPESIAQAVIDAGYEGPTIDYHP